MPHNLLGSVPLRVRVLWKPSYEIIYDDDFTRSVLGDREPYSFDGIMATTGGPGNWLYGILSQAPQLVTASPEHSKFATQHEVEYLWAELVQEITTKSDTEQKFKEAMERAALIARGLRKEGIA